MDELLAKITPMLTGVGGMVLVFGLAVFVHELGHFVFARLRGVGVEAFAIGMGPKIVAWKRGQTEYSIRWLPLGGFVRLHQMIREDAEAEEKPAEGEPAAPDAPVEGDKKESVAEAVHSDMEALYDKGLFTKLLVFGGGVFFNYLMAIVAMTLLFTMGFSEQVPKETWVGEIKSEAIAQAGLLQGDRFVEIEGVPVEDFYEVYDALIAALDGPGGADGLDVVVLRPREGAEPELVALSLPPLIKDSPAYFIDEESEALSAWEWGDPAYIADVIPYRPAAKGGLEPADLVVRINDTPIHSWMQMVRIINASPDEPIVLYIRRKGLEDDFFVTLIPEPNIEGKGMIGIVGPGSAHMKFVREPFLTAAKEAPRRTTIQLRRIAVTTFSTLFGAFASGNPGSLKREMGGPIAILNLTYKQANKGFADLIQWFIMLNLILAIMNLLPIPILDGGYIMLSTIEAIVRRPIPTRVLMPLYTFFFFCFIGLFILLSYQDILNIFVR